MHREDALAILSQLGAVLTNDHFVFTSGRHGSDYVNKDAISAHAPIYQLCCGLAERCCSDLIDVVVAPAVGGIALAQWVAHRLRQLGNRPVAAAYAEREETGIYKADHDMTVKLLGSDYKLESGDEVIIKKPSFVLKRGFDALVKGKRVCVVEDILTTGGSARKVIEAARRAGGNVVVACALVNRGNITAEMLGNISRLEALVDIQLDSWLESECPLCKEGKPINPTVGKGKDFLARKQSL